MEEIEDVEVIALEDFPFSRNGIKIENAVANSTFVLPGRLFEGLNATGKVRRALIGDGHISLRATPPVPSGHVAGVVVNDSPASADLPPAPGSAEVVVAPPAPNRVASTIRNVVNAAKALASGVSTPAPQPAAATADLTADEIASIADGSWKDWRFFKQRSVAAKLSKTPIKDGADAKAAIEAYIASKAL